MNIDTVFFYSEVELPEGTSIHSIQFTKVGQLNCETHSQEASRCVADISCSGNYTLRSWWRGWGMAMTMTTIRKMMIIMIMIIMMWWWWWCGDITSNPIDDQHFDIWVYMGYILPNLPTTNMTTLPWLGFFSWGVGFFSKSAGKLGWKFYQQSWLGVCMSHHIRNPCLALM